MNNYNKINWKKGLDITPEIFIESDNYHIEERCFLGRFFASRLWGILPKGKFNINFSINSDENILNIDCLECSAITHDGYIINVGGGITINKEISLIDAVNAEYYVVLTVDPYSIKIENSTKTKVIAEYDIVLKNTFDAIEKGIPILKLQKNSFQEWAVDDIYIPPSIAINSVDKLRNQYIEIKNKANDIIEILPEDYSNYMQAMLFLLELDNYNLEESPQELALLMKKFSWILKQFLKTEKKISDMPSVEAFTKDFYNHIEIGNSLKSGLMCLLEIEENLNKKIEIIDDVITV